MGSWASSFNSCKRGPLSEKVDTKNHVNLEPPKSIFAPCGGSLAKKKINGEKKTQELETVTAS